MFVKIARLLTRHVYAEVPPRVEYALTSLGKQFMQPVRGLVTWLQAHWSTIRAARESSSDGRQVARRREVPSREATPMAARRCAPTRVTEAVDGFAGWHSNRTSRKAE
jgi:HxlR-like helix-turn-helix protein